MVDLVSPIGWSREHTGRGRPLNSCFEILVNHEYHGEHTAPKYDYSMVFLNQDEEVAFIDCILCSWDYFTLLSYL